MLESGPGLHRHRRLPAPRCPQPRLMPLLRNRVPRDMEVLTLWLLPWISQCFMVQAYSIIHIGECSWQPGWDWAEGPGDPGAWRANLAAPRLRGLAGGAPETLSRSLAEEPCMGCSPLPGEPRSSRDPVDSATLGAADLGTPWWGCLETHARLGVLGHKLEGPQPGGVGTQGRGPLQVGPARLDRLAWSPVWPRTGVVSVCRCMCT